MTKNAWLEAFYDRLVVARKCKKLAMVVAMRKLLAVMLSRVEYRTTFAARIAT